jgi:hypothetical protein
MDVPVGQFVGLSGRRERLWSVLGGLVVVLAIAGGPLVSWLVQGTPLGELWGIPYPPLFGQRAMIVLDYYSLGLVGLGLVFLEGAVLALRSSRYPRTDGTRAAMLGMALCAVGGLVLFARLWAVVHG